MSRCVVKQKYFCRFCLSILSISFPRCNKWASWYAVRSNNWSHWLFLSMEQSNSSFQRTEKLNALLWSQFSLLRFQVPEGSLPPIHVALSKLRDPCLYLGSWFWFEEKNPINLEIWMQQSTIIVNINTNINCNCSGLSSGSVEILLRLEFKLKPDSNLG